MHVLRIHYLANHSSSPNLKPLRAAQNRAFTSIEPYAAAQVISLTWVDLLDEMKAISPWTRPCRKNVLYLWLCSAVCPRHPLSESSEVFAPVLQLRVHRPRAFPTARRP